MNRKTLIIGINLGDSGSTGTIMRNSLEFVHDNGDFDYLIVVPKSESRPHTFAYAEGPMSLFERFDRHILHRSINNPDGFFDRAITQRIIRKIKTECYVYDKIIVHMHNIHMARIDLRILFKYLSKEKRIKKVFYTLHDCWSFTGGCYHFEKCGCNKWRTGCKGVCPQNFGRAFFKCSKNLALKNKYTHLLKEKLTLLPVSEWCNSLLKQSSLNDIESIVINGECSIAPLRDHDLSLKEILGIGSNDKTLITVDGWKAEEFLNQFIAILPDNYKFIVINGGRNMDRAKNVISINSVPNLIMPLFYSISDCFISLTQEDTLPLTIMEAQICGLPVVGFGHGGTPEEIVEGVTGTMVGVDNDVQKILGAAMNAITNNPYKKDDIVGNGRRFEKYSYGKAMLELYKRI